MRISTQTFFEKNLTAMGTQQERLFRTQQKLSVGTRYLTPADDPVAAARAVNVSESIAETAQYAASLNQATRALSQEEQALQTSTSILQNIKTLAVQAGNGTLSDKDRLSLAASIQSNADQLLSVANSVDGNGQYLFAGHQSASPPFTRQADGRITYSGDQGQRLMQVDGFRQMSVADDGRSVFQSIQSATSYVNVAAAGNKGSGVLGPTSVVDASAPDFGKDFVIGFSGGNYTVSTDASPPVTVASGPFVPDSPIVFGGLQVSLSGTPADGDTFQVSTARNAGTDMFAAISDLVAALKAPLTGGGAEAKARLSNALGTASVKLNNALENVLTVRSSVGSRMVELDAIGAAGASRDLIDQSYLSELRDLDYASAISEFSQRETTLKATQQTFARLSNIALFNYL